MSEIIERVLVALDATAETRTAIDTAAGLAARAKAPLHAVFVEDEDLLSLASLPIARQVIRGAGAGPLTTEEVELHLRAAATRAREDILVAARMHSLECSFEIVRGGAEAALSAASEHDLIVAGALARPVAGHFRVESRWLAALDLAPGPFLLTRESRKQSSRVVVLLRERGAGSGRLLQAAARMAELGGHPLTVICPSALVAAKGFAKWVDEQIEPSTVQLQIEAAPAEPAALQARIAELDCGLLAIGAGAAEGGPERLRELTERLDCDVLIVR
jgi:nucleotide-binding universal stress UspA family protein